jgi:signal transduction histidine kinase
MQKQRTPFQYAYLVTLALLGIGSSAAVAYRGSTVTMPSGWLLLGIAVAYILSDYYGVSVETATPGSYYSLTVTDASIVFAAMVAGPYGLFPILLGSFIVRYLQRKWEQPLGYIFNVAQRATGYSLWLALEIASLALVPALAHGVLNLVRLAGIMALYLLWDIFYFSLLVSVGTRQPVKETFREQLTPTAWIDVIPISMGAIAALMFFTNPWMVVLVILPIFLAYRAMIAVVQRLELMHALERANAQLEQANELLEQRVTERTADLERALRIKDDFVAIVTHELRTPLTSIVGSLGMLADMLPQTTSTRMRRMIAIAHKNSERLARLVNDMLDLQKFAAQSMTFNLQPVDITALIDQAIETNRVYAMSCNVTLAAHHQTRECFVMGDVDRLIQVLTNLLSNACKFSPSGGQVAITTERVEQIVRVAVADQGTGIPESFRPFVFEKFTQADSSSSRRHGGSGLGLSIAKAIIEAFGGTIGFTTNLGSGTTFFFELAALPSGQLHTDGLNTVQEVQASAYVRTHE